jgi:hypothetical protein
MARFYRLTYLFSAVALGVCVSLFAQTTQSAPPEQGKEIPAPASVDEAASGHVKIVPAPADVDEPAGRRVKMVAAPSLLSPSSPFVMEGNGTKPERSIRMLSEEEMSREDRDILANAESSIKEQAGIENLDLDDAGWSYRQLLCPALPNHVFLRFTRDDRAHEMSVFSAAIPRNGNGRVHVIPIVRKGYSLFSPAPIGAMTIAAFNRIRVEEGEGASADWLGTGLCYAVLAGANPMLGETPAEDNDMDSTVPPPTLLITSQGGATIRFADVSTTAKPMEWNIVFDPKGKLVKASHQAAQLPSSRKPAAVPEDFSQTK